MQGKVLDAVLLVAFAAIFIGVATAAPGVGVLVVALAGIVILGFYNSYVRHDRQRDTGPVMGRSMDHSESLRAAWR